MHARTRFPAYQTTCIDSGLRKLYYCQTASWNQADNSVFVWFVHRHTEQNPQLVNAHQLLSTMCFNIGHPLMLINTKRTLKSVPFFNLYLVTVCVCELWSSRQWCVLVWVWSEYSNLPFLWGDPPKQGHQSPSTQYSLLTCTIPHIPQWPTATKDCLLCLATEAYPVSRQAYKAKKQSENLKISCNLFPPCSFCPAPSS